MHLYQRYDVYSYEECIEKNLKEVNGWFGFYNKSIANTISFMPTLVSGVYTENDEYEYDINKVINNKSNNDFIDMYPTRSHYSFSPYYNSDKERLEKNWNYCITYPSESVVKMIDGSELPFFRYIQENDKETIALKVLMIDEYTVDDNGIKDNAEVPEFDDNPKNDAVQIPQGVIRKEEILAQAVQNLTPKQQGVVLKNFTDDLNLKGLMPSQLRNLRLNVQ